MKRNKIYAWLAAAMTFAACSTNDIADITHYDADNVVNVASVTRSGEGGTTTSPSAMTAPFHLINLTQQEKYGWKYEADYTYDATNQKYAPQNGGLVVWCNIKSQDTENKYTVDVENQFQAFSPLRTVANEASFDSFQILPDQSTADKLAAADWMTAEDKLTKFNENREENELALNFKHRNAKLHFKVSFKDDVAANNNITLTSSNFKVVGFITPCYTESTTDNSKTIDAIVYAKKDYSNVNLIEVTINFDANNSETYKVSLPSGLTQFEPGKQYNFNLVIGHDQASISSVYVTDWGEGSIDLNGNDDALLEGYKVDIDPETGVRTFTVSNYHAFKAWAQTNDVENTNITLDGDITVPAGETLPYISSFNGVFDGKGHTIKNIKNLVYGKNCILGSTNNGTIKNLNFEIAITTTIFLGIVSTNEGTIENCTISGSAITSQGDYRRFSGVCYSNIQNGKIIACVNNVTVNQPEGDITGTIISGGICEQNGGLIIGCINNGNISLVSANNTQYCVIAGIAAKSYLDERTKTPGKIIACANTGTITGNCPIFYKFYEVSTIDYCYWTQGSESTTNMTNSGKVTSWDDTTINALNTAQDGDNKSIQDYGYKFETDANGKLIIVPISSSSAAARR